MNETEKTGLTKVKDELFVVSHNLKNAQEKSNEIIALFRNQMYNDEMIMSNEKQEKDMPEKSPSIIEIINELKIITNQMCENLNEFYEKDL